MQRYSFIVALTLGIIGFSTRPAVAGGDGPRVQLQGTILQLTSANAAWPEAKWIELFDRFKRLSLSQLVVQWSTYDDLAFYPTATFTTPAHPPLPTILRLADQAGMTVLV